MECSDPTCEVEVEHILITIFSHQSSEPFLIWKLSDRVGQVLVGAERARDGSSDEWQNIVEIELKELTEDRIDGLREFQDGNAPIRFENAIKLNKTGLYVCQIAQSESA